jgi:PAS domain S-box-containing protein
MLLKKTIVISEKEPAGPVTVQKTILLVEDEPITAQSTIAQLKNRGYHVIYVSTGEAAIEEINANKHIDLIAMDIDLGDGIDGTAAAAAILKKHDIPLLFLSSHTEPEIVKKTEEITNYGYVVKNSSITVLDASIKMAFKLFEAKMREQEKEKILIRRNDLLQVVSDNMFDLVAITDLKGHIKLISRSNDILGYDPDKLIEKNIFSYVHPDDLPGILGAFQKALDTKTDGERVELRLRHSAGHYVWFETFGKYIKGSLLFSSRDITERKVVEEKLNEIVKKNKLLLKELQHRTKNHLNQIIGILDLMADPLPVQSQDLIRDIQTRISSISTIYELLYRTADLEHIDFADYIKKLTEVILKTFDHAAKNIQLKTDLTPFTIDAKHATELGLILNELITNTLKYAYPDKTSGELYIELKKENKLVTLIVADHGIGLPKDVPLEPPANSLGMMLATMLSQSLGGALSLEDNQPGVKTTITFNHLG